MMYTTLHICVPYMHDFETVHLILIWTLQVGMKLLWSSRDQRFVGHAMTHEDMTSLCDAYRTLHPDFRLRKTTYVLQTLWRDLTSNFDVLGPHYTSEGTIDVSIIRQGAQLYTI